MFWILFGVVLIYLVRLKGAHRTAVACIAAYPLLHWLILAQSKLIFSDRFYFCLIPYVQAIMAVGLAKGHLAVELVTAWARKRRHRRREADPLPRRYRYPLPQIQTVTMALATFILLYRLNKG
ncbi:MAG: hypothetical protein M5R36_14605 [Deltaproteobacteria bacterium]|nr:hypothetical protein [Deltaproteobacteria bacterium]